MNSSITEVKQSGLDTELQKLRGEKKLLLQEVACLKQEHLTTVQQMDSLNKRLQSAEMRQKQMVTFLAKVFQNPEFLGQIRKQKAHREILSARAKRKFLKQHSSKSDSDKSLEQIVNYGRCAANVSLSSSQLGFQSDLSKKLQDDFLEGMVDKLGLEPSTQGLLVVPEHARLEMAPSSLDSNACTFKGKDPVTFQIDDSFEATEYYVSFPEDISPEKIFSETIVHSGEVPGASDSRIFTFEGHNTSSGGIDMLSFPECVAQGKGFTDASTSAADFTMGDVEPWDAGLEIGGSSICYGQDLWASLDQNVPELEGVVAGPSALWDPVLQTIDEGLQIDEFLSVDSTSHQSESQAALLDEDSNKIEKA
ncbi:hypothetical protein J5N97_021417 [Dioscorea zingiberensis]|uniref:Heat stress transcription factor A-3 n=1 Tax=Dioscorea zingiberensis TaxID=325984 RepID=A0A9D5HEK9_9LILI|nr:hypothetical protein J5N97_021417 [Dioscorea zingiberensis]